MTNFFEHSRRDSVATKLNTTTMLSTNHDQPRAPRSVMLKPARALQTPPATLKLKLFPPADHTGSLPKMIVPPQAGDAVVNITAMGKYIAAKVAEVAANDKDIEMVHVYTHSAGDPSTEGDVGLFSNRGRYFSALRRTEAVDNYAKIIVPIDCPAGIISFETEAVVTEHLRLIIPYIKDVDLIKLDSWATVLANKKIGVGAHNAKTKLFVSFSFGLKECLAKGSIKVNPTGKVPMLTCLPFKPHKPHEPRGPHTATQNAQIGSTMRATLADPASLHAQRKHLNNADKKAQCNADVKRHATTLIGETYFPKKPLRQSHLCQPHFTALFGLAIQLSPTKAKEVFDSYVIMRAVRPVISICGK